MDGNRRYAKERGLPTLEGHRKGYEKLKEALRWGKDAGVENIIVYAFSTENWKRSADEVSYLLDLFRFILNQELEHFHKEGGIIKCLGNLDKFPEDIQKLTRSAEEKTKGNPGPRLYIALSYGGRDEILSAVKKIVSENPKPEDITEEYFAKHLQTYPMPDPDIIVRTSGEKRLSGFLPWQGVYSELFFIDTYWPAFSKEEFDGILKEYENRHRRFGA